jgi:hypothetical protein
MKKNASKAPTRPISRERLNRLMDAMALIIVRRQMKHHWATGHRASLPSII